MTALELSSNVGKIGSIPLFIRTGSIIVNVRIEGFKVAYGCPRYLITPVSGTGSQWVNADRVQFVNDSQTERDGQ